MEQEGALQSSLSSTSSKKDGNGVSSKARAKREAKLEQQNVLSVARTNDESIVSKRSAARAGYMKDEFLADFVRKPAQRSALINRGYYARCHAIRAELRGWIRRWEGQPCQIVSLGAGFDTSFFVLAAEGNFASRYFEVDFPHVLARKRTVIEHTPHLISLLGEPLKRDTSAAVILESPRYVCVGSDLSDLGGLRNHLLLEAKLDYNIPTLVLAECVLTYMNHADSDRVIHWVRSAFRQATFLCYEQVRPNDAFGKVMRANLDARGSSLLGVQAYPTLEAQRKRYHDLGYAHVRICTIGDVWRDLPVQERERIEDIEEFDEREEWDEKGAHYVVVVASPPSVEESGHAVLRASSNEEAGDGHSSVMLVEELKSTGRMSDCKLWGHSAVSLRNDSLVVVFGGYGGGHRHQRVNTVLAIDCAQLVAQVVVPRGVAPVARMQHGACALAGENSRILIHGGRSGPSNAMKDFHILHAATGEQEWAWETFTVEETGSIAVPSRYRHSLTRIENTCMVFGFGGKSSWKRGSICGDGWVLNTETRILASVQFQDNVSPPARASHCTLWCQGSIYIYGGLGQDGAVLDDFWRVTFLDVACTRAKAENISQSLRVPHRYSHSGNMFRGIMYFSGGSFLSNCNTVVEVDVASLTCTVYATNRELPSRHCSVVSGNGIVLVGGGLTCFSFGSSFEESLLSIPLDGISWIAPPRQISHDAPSRTTTMVTSNFSTAIAPAPAAVGGASRRKIPLIDRPTTEQFHAYLTKIREPCLFSNVGLPSWCKDDIKDAVPADTQASIHVCQGPLLDFTNKNYRFEVTSFDAMLERIEDPAEHLYFRSLGSNARKDPSNVSESFPKLAAQFTVPAFAASFVRPETLHSSCLRLSSSDIQMWTHYDINDNILCGIRGRKRLLLWHPEEVRHLYVDGTASLVLDVDHPDLERFPKFAKAVAWEGILEEGQVLFIPAMWFHNVRTLSPCYGLNFFFRHLPIEMYQTNDLYGNRDPVPAQKAHKNVQNAMDQLAELPEGYRRFFLSKLILELKKSLN